MTPTAGDRDAAIAAHARDANDIAARIAEGLIPPAPSYVDAHGAWLKWYDAHVRCSTWAHQLFVRERGSDRCAFCNAGCAP